MTKIDIKSLTLDQYRRVLWISVTPGIEKTIRVSTWYRIRDWKNKHSPQPRTLCKLKDLFEVDMETLNALIENQLKQNSK